MLKTVGRIVFAPAKGLNVVARKIATSEIVELLLVTVLSFLVIMIVAANFWPISNGWELLLVAIITLVGIGLAIGLASAILIVVTSVIIYATDSMACIYDKCAAPKLQETFSQAWGINKAPNAKVSLQYFIEQEKNRNICYAKYLG